VATQRYRIEFADSALEDLRSIPKREADQIFAKFNGWKMDWSATSSDCKTPTLDFGCAWAIIGFYLM